jgi:hypothetical protein
MLGAAGPQQRLPYSEFLQKFFKQIQDRPKVRCKLVVSDAAKHTHPAAVGRLMEIAMREAARIVAVAPTVICLCLIAAMPIVAGWSMPTEQALPPRPINPLKLMEQAKQLQAQQITDFSTIH